MRSPRFVILHHRTPDGYDRPDHWDLMLQAGNELRTWALERCPAVGRSMAAEELAAHRIDYLELEGAVSGGRGTVKRVERGIYEYIEDAPLAVRAVLRGENLACRLEMTRIDTANAHWTARFAPLLPIHSVANDQVD